MIWCGSMREREEGLRERESKRDKEIGREHKEKTHKYIKGRKGKRKREWAKDERKINNAKN